jgi:type I restriction enzyme S subunit
MKKNVNTITITEKWEVKKLGEIVDILDNLRRPITKRDRVEGQFPYYGATGILSYVHDFIFSEKLVLIGEDGAKWLSGDNTSFIAEGKYWVNNHAHVIRPKREIVIDEWIVYFLNFSDLTKYISGMTVPKLNQEKMRSIEIPIPSVQNQRKILANLDQSIAAISKAKANAEQNLKNAKELFERFLQSEFEKKGRNWEIKLLGEVCEIMNGGTPDTTIAKFWDGQNLWITPKDMGKLKGIYVSDTSRKLTNEGLKNSSAKILPINSIILSTRAPIGHLAINKRPISTNQGCKGLVPNKEISSLFVYYFLLMSVDLLNHLGTGATFKELSGSKLGAIEIPVPTLQEQQTVVEKLNKLLVETQKLEVIYKQKLNDLEELKKSILQKAFKGELKTAAPLA